MTTLTRMHIDDMISGAKCIVVYGDKPSDIEEAEIIELRLVERMSSWVSPWEVHVRFADGVEVAYHPRQICEIK